MIGTPERAAETPLRRDAGAGCVDLLSDLLGTVHLSGAILFRAELAEPWAVSVPEDWRQLQRATPGET